VIIKNLRLNQLTPEGFAWYLRVLDSVDARDIVTYASYLSEDTSAQVNNIGPVTGRQNVVNALTPVWLGFGGLEHDLRVIVGDDTSFAVEAVNRYTLWDGTQVFVNATAFYDRAADGLVKAVRMYGDMSKVTAGAPAKPDAAK